MRLPVYLDYMATTPVDPRVTKQMLNCLSADGNFGNASSKSHSYGWQAREAIELAREQFAALINATPDEIIWTSGATESDNLAIIGAVNFYQRKGRHIVTCTTEHSAVLDTCQYLQTQGFEVTLLAPEPNGLLDPNKLAAAMRDDTLLVSIMHANNEIGVIQDITALSKIVHQYGALLHSDGAQSAGKIPVDVRELDVDLMSFSGHKMYAPKGVGVLYVRSKPKIRLQPLFHGGGHEHGLRSGTLATPQIVGMGEAARIATLSLAEESEQILALRNRLWSGIRDLPNVTVNGDLNQRIPGNLNVCFHRDDGDALLMALNQLAVSSSSACHSAVPKPSHVLKAIGLSDTESHSSIRFSMGRFTTEEEIDFAISEIHQHVK